MQTKRQLRARIEELTAVNGHLANAVIKMLNNNERLRDHDQQDSSLVGRCTREPFHDGPCNGWAKTTCPDWLPPGWKDTHVEQA